MAQVNYTTILVAHTKRNTITWTIPEFPIKCTETKEFRTAKSEDTSAELVDPRLELKMLCLGRYNDIIEIYYLSPNPVLLKLDLTLKYISIERTLAIKEYHTIQGNKWQYLTTLKDLRRKNYNDDFSASLQLKFQYTVINDMIVDRNNIPDGKVCNDFKKLLNEGLFSDVTIKSAEGAEFTGHKAVLASRSAVFKAHFEHNTTECITNIVESPLDSEVLREVLTFIYSDKAPRLEEMPERLLAGADYYQLSNMKSLCEEALHKKLTVENAIETLQLADLHSANTLKQLTLEFIKDGHAKLITKTEAWTNVKSVELIKRIYENIVDDTDDLEVLKQTLIPNTCTDSQRYNYSP